MDFESGLGPIDGTLRNPLVAAVVLIWALVLFSVCRAALKSDGRYRGVVVAAVLLGGWLLEPRIVAALVNGVYRVTASASAGLSGQPPAWAASLIAAVALLIERVLQRRRRSPGRAM